MSIAIKAVIFDLDGVLVDSGSVYDMVFDRWLWEQKIPAQVREKILSRNINMPGMTWEDLIHATNEIAGTHHDYKKVQLELSDRIVRNILDVGVPLKPGALEAVRKLKEHYILGVASNSLRMVIERMLRHQGLYEYIQAFTGVDDVHCGKPHPAIYQKTMQALHVRPEETVVIEDTSLGAQAGAAAGAFVYVIPDQNTHVEQFTNIAEVVPNFDRILASLL